MTRAAFALLAALAVLGCDALPGSKAADAAAVRELQTLATAACRCGHGNAKSYWHPGSDEAPLPCWEEFAAALKPYSFETGPVTLCGEESANELDEIFLGGTDKVVLRYGYSTCSAKEAELAGRAEKKRRLAARDTEQTCG